jgi:MFS superfamily sulfate permease-like transporter
MDFLQFNGQNTFTAIGDALQHIAPGSVIIGVVSLLLMLLWDTKAIKRLSFTKMVPGALIAVIVSIIINELFKRSAPDLQIKPEHLVRLPVVSSFAGLLAEMTSPDWSVLTKYQTYVVAGTIGIVASLETLLSVEAVDKLDPH